MNFRTGRPEGRCTILTPRLSSLSLAEPDGPTRLAQEPPYGPRCKLRPRSCAPKFGNLSTLQNRLHRGPKFRAQHCTIPGLRRIVGSANGDSQPHPSGSRHLPRIRGARTRRHGCAEGGGGGGAAVARARRRQREGDQGNWIQSYVIMAIHTQKGGGATASAVAAHTTPRDTYGRMTFAMMRPTSRLRCTMQCLCLSMYRVGYMYNMYM